MNQNLQYRHWRESLTLSAEDLASWIKVNPRTIQSWESGREDLPHARFIELMNLVDEFFNQIPNEADSIIKGLKNQKEKFICFLSYIKEKDYQSVAWPDNNPPWPTAKMHRFRLSLIAYEINKKNISVIFIPFDLDNYLGWLSGKTDSHALREDWAKQQALKADPLAMMSISRL